MNRKEILENYDVDKYGIITSPGKFEGEMLFVPHFYDVYLNGGADDCGKYVSIEITAEDRAEFPEIPKRLRKIQLIITSTGFVCWKRMLMNFWNSLVA